MWYPGKIVDNLKGRVSYEEQGHEEPKGHRLKYCVSLLTDLAWEMSAADVYGELNIPHGEWRSLEHCKVLLRMLEEEGCGIPPQVIDSIRTYLDAKDYDGAIGSFEAAVKFFSRGRAKKYCISLLTDLVWEMAAAEIYGEQHATVRETRELEICKVILRMLKEGGCVPPQVIDSIGKYLDAKDYDGALGSFEAALKLFSRQL